MQSTEGASALPENALSPVTRRVYLLLRRKRWIGSLGAEDPP
jgi:hypothetical protein